MNAEEQPQKGEVRVFTRPALPFPILLRMRRKRGDIDYELGGLICGRGSAKHNLFVYSGFEFDFEHEVVAANNTI